jgi:hypothetical protein
MASDNSRVELHRFLSGRVKAFDQELLQEYSPSVDRIESIRYRQFKECVLQTNDTQACYRKARDYELRVDFDLYSRQLDECVNRAAGGAWEKQGERCWESYARDVRGAVERELSRILGNIKN